jgi:hypothetical protein
MRTPVLSVYVRDRVTQATAEHRFTASPVLVGRGQVNGVRLSADNVSRYHGALLFGDGSLRWVDFGSTNGTMIDGVAIDVDALTDIVDASVIDVGQYRLTVALHLVAPNPRNEAECEGLSPSPGTRHADERRGGAAVLSLVPPESTREYLSADAAAEVTQLVAELLLRFSDDDVVCASRLRANIGSTAAELVSYLTEPGAPGRLDHLRASLTAVFQRSHLVSDRGGTS